MVPGKFHHAVLFEVRIAIDAKTLGAAFAAVRDRHEGLRTTFSPGPMVAPPGAPAPYVREVTDLSAVLPEMMAPFDLAAGELFRLAIIRSGESAPTTHRGPPFVHRRGLLARSGRGARHTAVSSSDRDGHHRFHTRLMA